MRTQRLVRTRGQCRTGEERPAERGRNRAGGGVADFLEGAPPCGPADSLPGNRAGYARSVTDDEQGAPGLPSGEGPPGEGEGAADRAEREHPVFELGTDGPKVIMAGVDGSDSSWRAASYAAGLARRQGALLALVYVQPIPVSSAPGVVGVMAQAAAEIAEEIGAQARRDAERLGDVYRNLRWEFHTFRGDPYSGLVRTADDLRADAVVVGASEKAGHRFIGSLAVRLVKAARWPVTVVP